MISNKRVKQKIISKYIDFNSTKMTNLKKLIEKSKIGDGDWILSDDMCEFSNNKLIQLGSIGYGIYNKKGFKYISDDKFDELKCSEISEGDLLINRFITNNTMTCCIVSINEKRLLTSVDVCWIKEDKSKYLNKYLMYCFLSEEFQRKVLSLSSGTTRIRISKSNLSKIDFPIPPLEEQKKIVKKIEELFEFIDKKEKNDKEKEKLKTLLKGKILDSAIRGELVENDLSLPAIDVEEMKKEIPFAIPSNWKWTTFNKIIDVRDGTHDSPKYVEYSDYPLITSKNLTKNGLNFENVNYLTKKDYELINVRSFVDNGDILFAMIGSIGNPVLVNKTRNFAIKNVALFKCSEKIYNKYLYYYLQSQGDMSDKTKGGVQKFVSLKILRNYLIPLPPLEQQKKIVVKIEKCFELMEQL